MSGIAVDSKSCEHLSPGMSCPRAVVCQVVMCTREGFLPYWQFALPFHGLHGDIAVELAFFTPSRLGSQICFSQCWVIPDITVCVALGPYSLCPLCSLPALHVSGC